MQTVSSVDPANIGAGLKSARQTLGWSLAEVSRRTGLSRAYINALENGKGKRPGAETLRRLEDVFGPLGDSPPRADLPPGLGELVRERNLPDTEASVLASLRIRGEQPQSVERWRFIYDALVASESIDRTALRNAGR